MNASVYTLFRNGRGVSFQGPREIGQDPPRVAAQGVEALRVLRALNAGISGNELHPCQQITVFNTEVHA